MTKIKKWIISAATLTVLALVGYQLADFDEDRGYPLINQGGDTLWFDDSLGLVAFSDSIRTAVADSIFWANSTIDTSHVYVCVNYEGKLVDYVDPKAWKKSADTIFSGLNKAFKYMQWPRAQIPQLRDLVADTTDKWRVDFNILADSLHDPSFADSFHTENTTVILPRGPPYSTMVKDKKDVNNPVIIDRFAHTIGDSTWGIGGSFATLATCLDDLGDTLTGAVNHIQISSTIETGIALITESLDGNAYAITSDNPHYGDPTAGYTVTGNVGGASIIELAMEGPGNVVVEHLHLIKGTQDGGWVSIFVRNVDAACSITVRNNLLNGDDRATFGILLSDATPVISIYNNVIWDHGDGLKTSAANANNLIENNIAASCTKNYDLNGQSGAWTNNAGVTDITSNFLNMGSATGNNNASDDATAGDGNWSSGSNNQINITLANEFVSTTDTDADFFKAKNDGVCWDGGTAPTIAADTLGIRGNRRPGLDGLYSIGADEFTEGTIYRSVGKSGVVEDDNSGARTMTISTDTATFSSGVCDSMGVGDIITFNDGTNDTCAVVHRRFSSTQFRVKNPDGVNPRTTTDNAAWDVYRAHASLADAEAGTKNASITTCGLYFTNDLVSIGEPWFIACYGDVGDAECTVSGWITSAPFYLRIFTPYDTTDVGASQRHDGKWKATAYTITTSGGRNIDLSDDYIRIEGIQVDNTRAIDNIAYGVSCNAQDYTRVSYCIIRFTGGTTLNVKKGIFCAGDNSLYWNNVVYGWRGSSDVNGAGMDIRATTNGTPEIPVYNNTVYDCGTGFTTNKNTAVVLKNNIAYLNADNYTGLKTWDALSTNNLSGTGTDADMPATNKRDGVEVTFETAGSDFHLASGDTGAIDYGTDLSTDPNGLLSFTLDIDMVARTGTWDIGADQFISSCSPSYDTTNRDTVGVDTTCLSLDSLQVFSADSQQVDSICGVDTTLNWAVTYRESIFVDTTGPTLDTALVGCDSVQYTISACTGDTTNTITFFNCQFKYTRGYLNQRGGYLNMQPIPWLDRRR